MGYEHYTENCSICGEKHPERDMIKALIAGQETLQKYRDEEINRLADGMEVDKSEVLRVWEEHKDD